MKIGEGAVMIDDHRVRKVIKAVNEKWLERENRSSKEETEDAQKGRKDDVD